MSTVVPSFVVGRGGGLIFTGSACDFRNCFRLCRPGGRPCVRSIVGLRFGSLFFICYHSVLTRIGSVMPRVFILKGRCLFWQGYVTGSGGIVLFLRGGLVFLKKYDVSVVTFKGQMQATERQVNVARRSLTTHINVDPDRVDVIRQNIGIPHVSAIMGLTGRLSISTSCLLRSSVGRSEGGRLLADVVRLPRQRQSHLLGGTGDTGGWSFLEKSRSPLSLYLPSASFSVIGLLLFILGGRYVVCNAGSYGCTRN